MTIKEELISYCNLCINDAKISKYENYISCKKHKQACKRFLNDLEKEKNENFIFFWNEEEAVKIVEWFKLLTHSKGVLAKKPIILTPWQKFVLCQLYGWRNKKNNKKRFEKAFVEVARKNAKSQMLAGIALYEISTQATKNGEVYECYTAGVKRDQSKIIFNEAKLMLENSLLKPKFKLTRDIIKHNKSGSFIKALSKEDGKKGDGTNPAVLILDEYHQHATTEFYDLGLGANTKEPLLVIITTAGVDLTYPCFTQEYKYCSELLNSETENEEYFCDICEIDKEDLEDLENEEKWCKANPIRMTYDDGIKKISNEYKLAKQIPEKKSSFLTKCLNFWVQAKENSYIDFSKWEKCVVEKVDDTLTRGKEVYVGLDMSAKIDLTSVSFVIPIRENEKVYYIVFSHSFIPNREKLIERIQKDKQPYDLWENQGYLTILNKPIIDQSAVIDWVLDWVEKKGLIINTFCVDPANAGKLMADISEMGYDVEEVYQSYRSLNESTNGFREQVYSENVIVEKNDLLDFSMKNAIIKENDGFIKIDKEASKKRIDPVDALLCAYKLAIYHEFSSKINDYLDEYLDNI